MPSLLRIDRLDNVAKKSGVVTSKRKSNVNGLRPNTDATGRTKWRRFVQFDYSLLESPGYRSLSPDARTLLVELAMLYNGANNGEIFLSVSDAAKRIGVTRAHRAGDAFKELETAGFIHETKRSHFTIKSATGSRARHWRLTWQPVADSRGPSKEFMDYQPPVASPQHKRLINGQEALKRYKKKLQKFAVTPRATENAKPVSHRVMPSEMFQAKAGLAVTPSDTAKNVSACNSTKYECDAEQHVYNIPSGCIVHCGATMRATEERASQSSCEKLRAQARQWKDSCGVGGQGKLAVLSGFSPAKMSRFLGDTRAKRTLTLNDFARLTAAIEQNPRPHRVAVV